MKYLAYFFGVVILLSIILQFGKELLTIVIVIAVLKYIYKYYEQNKEIKKSQLLSNIYQEDKKIANNFLCKYCNSIAKSWGSLPPAQLYPLKTEEVEVVARAIKSETGRDIDRVNLSNIINEALTEKSNEVFSTYMNEIILNKCLKIDLRTIVSIYCDAIPKSLKMLNHLKFFLSSKGIQHTDDLEKIVEEHYYEQTITKQASNLLHIVNSEKAMFRPISIKKVDTMDGIEFEHFLAKLFTKMGYYAQVTKASGDQGADLLLEKHGQKTVVQAKRYSRALDNTPVQEIVGAKAYYRV